MNPRPDVRNVAVVANIDHGKTTLTGALLHATGSLRDQAPWQAIDRLDLEREKGITILAKNASLRHRGVKINLIDTPGHADFGAEVERALAMVDGVLLLVDACEGPQPQTRFVLAKTLAARLPLVLALTKADRAESRPKEVLDETLELLIDLGADGDQIDLPVLACSAREEWASTDLVVAGENFEPLLDALIDTLPAPHGDPDQYAEATVAMIDHNPYLGTLALCRVEHGCVRQKQTLTWHAAGEDARPVTISHLFTTEGLERVEVQEAPAGHIVVVAGIPGPSAGDVLTENGHAPSRRWSAVEDPVLALTIGANTSPFASREGTRVAPPAIRDRLAAEVARSLGMRVRPGTATETWDVEARGELQLAVLVETMRREGFELTIGKPRILTRENDGQTLEPIEHLSLEIPQRSVGGVTKALSARRGRIERMTNRSSGWLRLECVVPARALLGFRTEYMILTHGEGALSMAHGGYEPWFGDIKIRPNGSLIADREGLVTSYALRLLEDRGTFFVQPGTLVYEGMIVGEHCRPEDLPVNPAREKKLTNMRSSGADVLERPVPIRPLTLEQALEFIAEDECVEVTPKTIRLRKATLSAVIRRRRH